MRLAWLAFVASCTFSNSFAPGDGGTQLVVGFERATSVEDEASDVVMVPVKLDPPATGTVTVDYEVSDGSARRGSDYTAATTGRLTFNTGDTVQYVPVTIIADGEEEGDETIRLSLKAANGASLAIDEHILAISADILPRVRFTTLISNGLETQPSVQLVLELDVAAANQVTVDYVLTGKATSADYNLAAGTVAFPAGTKTRMIDLAPIDDLLDEDPEDVVITLMNPQDVIIKPLEGVRTHTLDDNDPTPTIRFTQASSMTTEGGAATVTLTVVLSAVSGRTVTMPFTGVTAQTNGAGAADYMYMTASPLVIPAGTQMMTIVVKIEDDTLDEFVESFSTVIGTPTNADLAAMMTSYALSIDDDDGPPNVSFDSTQADLAVAEGNNGNPKTSYKLKLSTASGKPITVAIVYSGDAETNGLVDYTAPVSVMFAPGALEATLTLDIVPDTGIEPDETVIMDIPNNGSLTDVTRGSPATRMHTIVNDD